MYEIMNSIYNEALTDLVSDSRRVQFYNYTDDDVVIRNACEELDAEKIAFIRIHFATEDIAYKFVDTFVERAHNELVKCHLKKYESNVFLSTKVK